MVRSPLLAMANQGRSPLAPLREILKEALGSFCKGQKALGKVVSVRRAFVRKLLTGELIPCGTFVRHCRKSTCWYVHVIVKGPNLTEVIRRHVMAAELILDVTGDISMVKTENLLP